MENKTCVECGGKIITSDDRLCYYCSKCGLVTGELWYFDDVSYDETGAPQREFSYFTPWTQCETKPLSYQEMKKILGHEFAYGLFRRKKKM